MVLIKANFLLRTFHHGAELVNRGSKLILTFTNGFQFVSDGLGLLLVKLRRFYFPLEMVNLPPSDAVLEEFVQLVVDDSRKAS
jgi:hypothetical protein